MNPNSCLISPYYRCMKIRSHLLLIISLVVSVSLQAYAMPGVIIPHEKAEIEPVDIDHSDSTTHDLLFSIHHESERALHSTSSVSLQTAENLTEEEVFGTQAKEQFYTWLSSYYLQKLAVTDISLTVRKLIFPFHSHL